MLQSSESGRWCSDHSSENSPGPVEHLPAGCLYSPEPSLPGRQKNSITESLRCASELRVMAQVDTSDNQHRDAQVPFLLTLELKGLVKHHRHHPLPGELNTYFHMTAPKPPIDLGFTPNSGLLN